MSSLQKFLGQRFNRSKTLPKSVRVMRWVSMTGISIAVCALIVASSIGRGFERTYKESLLNFNAHLVVMGAGEVDKPNELIKRLDIFSSVNPNRADKKMDHSSFFLSWLPLLEKVLGDRNPWLDARKKEAYRSIVAKTPFIYREALLIGGGEIKGVGIKGVDPETLRSVNSMHIELFDTGKNLEEALAYGNKSAQIIVGRSLGEKLGLLQDASNRTVKLMIPTSDIKTKERKFEQVDVVGQFESGMHDYDAQYILMPLKDVRRLFGISGAQVTGIEIKLDDPEKATMLAGEINKQLHPQYSATTWSELNRELLSAIKIERLMSMIIMFMMVFVATMNIIAVLVLLTIYRLHEISILKAIGLSSKTLTGLLVDSGLRVGNLGVFVGLIGGIIVAFMVGKFRIVPLDAEIYLVDSLPIDISPFLCGTICLLSIGVAYMTSKVCATKLKNTPIAEGLHIAR